jgi:glycosyltransferase involved in cell wall biosynthesis
MDAMDSIGVVIPLYNKRRYIQRAISSVLAQTHREFLLTIVDDGSNDGSAEFVERLEDPRIRIIHTHRKGPGGARNAGIRATDAVWIGLLDADDHWHPDFLRKTVSVARQMPSLVAVFTDVQVAGASRPRRNVRSEVVIDYHLARMRQHVAISSSSILLHKTSFVAVGGFNEQHRYAEDIDAWFRLTCTGAVYYVHEALSTIEIEDATSATRTLSANERVSGLGNLLASYEAYRRENRIPADSADSCRRFMEHQRGRMAIHLCNSGQRKAGLRLLFGSVPLGTHTWREYLNGVTSALRPFFSAKG